MSPMKKMLPLLCFFLLLCQIHAQDFLWANSTGGTGGDRSKAIALDASNNVYSTGTFRDTADFDPSAGRFELISLGTNDIFIQKVDANGNFLWAKQFGGIGSDDANDIVTDANGSVYVTGSFRNTLDFLISSIPPLFSRVSAVGGADIFVLKLDANGVLQWFRPIGGTGTDEGNALALDAAGNVYVTGRFSDTVDFDPTIDTFLLTSAGSSSGFVQKLDGNGNFLWAKAFTGVAGTCEPFALAVDAANNVYTTGDFTGTIDFDPTAMVANSISNGASDIFIHKLTAAGNLDWVKQMGGTMLDEGHSIGLDRSGNLYTTGRFRDTVDFDPNVGTTLLGSTGSDDIYIHKMDVAGNLVWAKKMGGTGLDDARSIDVTANGTLHLTGYFQNTVDFGLGLPNAVLTSNGAYDLFIQKLDADGTVQWVKGIGGSDNDLGRDITSDNSGAVYYTAYYRDTVDVNPSIDNFTLIALGDYDMLVSKWDACGTARGTESITACQSYTWVNGNGNTYTSSTNSATDTLIGMAFDGCDSIVTLDLTLTLVDTSVTLNGNVLTATATNAAYQWIDCTTGVALANGTSQSFTPPTNGDFAVLITQNGCSVHSACYNVTWVGLSQLADSGLRVYPNPSAGTAYLELMVDDASVTVLDVRGQVVLESQVVTQSPFLLDLKAVPTGVYFVAVTTGNSQTVVKWVKR